MAHSIPPLSLSDIHNAYQGMSKKPSPAEAAKDYRKTDRFARDSSHSGQSPQPSSPTGRKLR